MLCVDVLVEEHLGVLLEFLFAFGGQVMDGAMLGDTAVHVGMSCKVVGEALCYVLPLWNDAHSGRDVAHDAGHEDWVVGATEHDSVDERVAPHELVLRTK